MVQCGLPDSLQEFVVIRYRRSNILSLRLSEIESIGYRVSIFEQITFYVAIFQGEDDNCSSLS